MPMRPIGVYLGLIGSLGPLSLGFPSSMYLYEGSHGLYCLVFGVSKSVAGGAGPNKTSKAVFRAFFSSHQGRKS